MAGVDQQRKRRDLIADRAEGTAAGQGKHGSAHTHAQLRRKSDQTLSDKDRPWEPTSVKSRLPNLSLRNNEAWTARPIAVHICKPHLQATSASRMPPSQEPAAFGLVVTRLSSTR